MHALFLTAGVLAVGFATELIFASGAVFWPAAALATLALLPEANLFSFAMTESLTFSLYSIAAWLLIRSLRQPRLLSFLFMGLTFGLLCLTRVSFTVLAPVALGIVVAHAFFVTRRSPRRIATAAGIFALGWTLVVGPWLIRNFVSVEKFGLTEEYGSATLVERLAFDDMHLDEFLLAFPYCLPAIGQPAMEWALGPQAMQRFDYQSPNSFFRAGRLHREQLVAAHGRLDPLIGKLVLDEIRQRGWKYFLSIIPLAWCGMWVGGMLGLVLVPLSAIACVRSRGEARLLLLFYSAPALVMLALHAAMANHYTRYNLILIGPFSAGAAWILANWGRRVAASLVSSLSPT
jgi:hypothetical protein